MNKAHRGGQPGNTNTMRHGLKAGKLPAGCRYIELRVCKLRRELEQIVVASKREVSLMDASCIKSICDWERHRALAARWLRLHGMDPRGRSLAESRYGDEGKGRGRGKDKPQHPPSLKPLEMLTFSREVAKASTEMDKLIRLLNLDRDVVKDAWASLDTPALPHHADGAGGTDGR